MLGRIVPLVECPFCHSELVPGVCEIRPLDFFFGRIGSTVLEFSHELTEYEVLGKAEAKASYYCEACGSAIVLDERVSL